MRKHAPTPPQWEAIQEPAGDSSEKDESDDDDEPIVDRRKLVQPGKRKDNGGSSARTSPVKRPRHDEWVKMGGPTRPPISSSVSAPGVSRQSLAQAGPSRLNAASGPSSQGVEASVAKPARSRYKPIAVFDEKDIPKPTKTVKHRKSFPTGTKSFFPRPTSSSQAKVVDKEVIEISSDEPEPPPPPKPSTGHRARKSTGSGPKPKSKAPSVIVITDSEEERAVPRSRLFELVRECAPPAVGSRRDRTLPSDDAMDVDYDAMTSPPMDVDTSPPLSPSSRPETSSPAGPVSPSRQSKWSSASPARKSIFDRRGLNTVPVPISDASRPVVQSKPRPQAAIKSASVFRRKASTSSSEEDSPDSPKVAPPPALHDGIDMRNLSDALNIAAPTPQAFPTARTSALVVDKHPPQQTHEAPVNNPFKTMQWASARKSIASSGKLTLVDALNAMGQSNAMIIKRRKKESHPELAAESSTKKDGESSTKPEPSNANPAQEQTALLKARESSKMLMNVLASKKGKERAIDTPPVAASPATSSPLRRSKSPSSQSSTGLHILSSSHPSPPTSPSPRLDRHSSSSIRANIAEVLHESLAVHERRPRSAPSLVEPKPTPTEDKSHIRPSASTLQSPSILAAAKAPEGVRIPIRPLSLNSLPKKPQVQSPQYVSATPSPLQSPTSEDHFGPSSGGTSGNYPNPARSPQHPAVITPPKRAVAPPPRSAVKSPREVSLPTSPRPQRTSFGDVSTPIQAQSVPSRATTVRQEHILRSPEPEPRAVLITLHSQSATPLVASDDEAMEDLAEVAEALVQTEAHTDMDVDHSQEQEHDDDVDDEMSEPSLPAFDAPRRSSRMSSRSSGSELCPATPDDEPELPQLSEEEEKDVEYPVAVRASKTYGGFQALTLKQQASEQKRLLEKCKYSRDLPHIFQDYVNDMPGYLRGLPEMRRVFEAMILENTVNDEPEAPIIEVQNAVDGEATPPWEFYYSNEMWHGEGVPHPDIDNLVGCTCKGTCNPRSKTCSCLQKQRDACQDPNLEFAYDKTGKLKIPGYPIFECNDLCGCGDECRNRVVQHGRKVSVAIRKTPLKGWGVFATKKIFAGSFIGIYSGELITDVVAHERGINYNKFGRTYLFDVDFHHLKNDDTEWTNKFTVDAYHAGNFTRFLNHSCDPNSRLFACYINEGNIDKPLLVIFSLRDIEANEEICFNYQGDYPGDTDEEEEEDDDDDTPNIIPETRDRIYEQCMCGTKRCTGIMFK